MSYLFRSIKVGSVLIGLMISISLFLINVGGGFFKERCPFGTILFVLDIAMFVCKCPMAESSTLLAPRAPHGGRIFISWDEYLQRRNCEQLILQNWKRFHYLVLALQVDHWFSFKGSCSFSFRSVSVEECFGYLQGGLEGRSLEVGRLWYTTRGSARP